MKRPERISPGIMAARKSWTTETPSTGPRSTSITLGGIRIPRHPPAVITPAERAVSYLAFIIAGAARRPITVTDAPIIPVAVAKTVAVRRTPRYKEPLIDEKINWNDLNRRSIRPACSSICPIKTNKGTAASTSSFINPIV